MALGGHGRKVEPHVAALLRLVLCVLVLLLAPLEHAVHVLCAAGLAKGGWPAEGVALSRPRVRAIPWHPSTWGGAASRCA